MKENPGTSPLREVLACYPKSGVAIQSLFDKDEEFRELCEDYAECTAVLDRLRREQGATDPRIEEYCELRVSLERDLQNRISESGTAMHPRGLGTTLLALLVTPDD